jgi:hypothetical protein
MSWGDQSPIPLRQGVDLGDTVVVSQSGTNLQGADGRQRRRPTVTSPITSLTWASHREGVSKTAEYMAQRRGVVS